MLGTLEMDVDSCIQRYLQMAPEVFPEEGFVSGSKIGKLIKGARGTARFDPKPLEHFVKQLVAERYPETGVDTIFDGPKKGKDTDCKVYVID